MTIFDADRPLSVGVLFSGGASGFRYLRDHDPEYNDTYNVVCGVTTNPDATGITAFTRDDIPVEIHDIRAFYDSHDAKTSDLSLRETYDEQTLTILRQYEPDVLLLSGYMWILTDPVIESIPTINVHPADLTITDDEGNREYVGFDPVTDAIKAGEQETRSTVHFVTIDVDDGPILVRSAPCRVHRELVSALDKFNQDNGIENYITAHQEWMKWSGDGPAIGKALSLISTQNVEIDGETVLIDDEPGYYDLETGDITTTERDVN